MNGDAQEAQSGAPQPPANRPLSVVNGRVDHGATDHVPARQRLVVAGTPVTIVEALSVALNAMNDLELVGVANSGNSMVRLVEARQPDALVVYAPRMEPEVVETIARLKGLAANVRIVLLTERPTVPVLTQTATAGVAACLPLDTGLRDLIRAVQADTTDTMLVALSSLATRAPAPEAAMATSPAVPLTPRELEVVTLLAEGCSPSGIAGRLVVSIHTARGHVKNVLRKLGAHSQLEAVVIATRMGVLPPSGTRGP